MSKRRRENMNRSNQKKKLAIAASALLPIAGTVIVPAMVAKKAIPVIKNLKK